MQAIRQVIDGGLLSKIIDLPQNFRGAPVEITITLAAPDETKVNPQNRAVPPTAKITRAELMSRIPGSHIDALRQALDEATKSGGGVERERLSRVTLEEIRAERLEGKYGSFN